MRQPYRSISIQVSVVEYTHNTQPSTVQDIHVLHVHVCNAIIRRQSVYFEFAETGNEPKREKLTMTYQYSCVVGELNDIQ